MPLYYAATSVANTLWRRGHRVEGRRRSARCRPWIGLLLINEYLDGADLSQRHQGPQSHHAVLGDQLLDRAARISSMIGPMKMAGLASRNALACAINCAYAKVSPQVPWRDQIRHAVAPSGAAATISFGMQGTTTGSRLTASPSFPLSVVTGCLRAGSAIIPVGASDRTLAIRRLIRSISQREGGSSRGWRGYLPRFDTIHQRHKFRPLEIEAAPNFLDKLDPRLSDANSRVGLDEQVDVTRPSMGS
jgi:hypothetical protein